MTEPRLPKYTLKQALVARISIKNGQKLDKPFYYIFRVWHRYYGRGGLIPGVEVPEVGSIDPTWYYYCRVLRRNIPEELVRPATRLEILLMDNP